MTRKDANKAFSNDPKPWKLTNGQEEKSFETFMKALTWTQKHDGWWFK